MFITDFIRYIGYSYTEVPCFDKNGNNVSDIMIKAVREQIDSGKPAIVWHAFTQAEYDVVCGYDEAARQFIGRGTYKRHNEYARESWDRAKTCDIAPAFGALLIGQKISEFDRKEAEINSLRNAVKHARKESGTNEGILFYRKWAEKYAAEGADRGLTSYFICFAVPSLNNTCVSTPPTNTILSLNFSARFSAFIPAAMACIG